MIGLPLQSECDPEDPGSFAMWALVGLPGPDGTAPLIGAPQMLAAWSERLWRCGFRHHPDLQEIKFVPPAVGHNWLSGQAAGRWAPVDEVLPAEVTAPDVEGLTLEEQRVLFERLQARFGPDGGGEPGGWAEVTGSDDA